MMFGHVESTTTGAVRWFRARCGVARRATRAATRRCASFDAWNNQLGRVLLGSTRGMFNFKHSYWYKEGRSRGAAVSSGGACSRAPGTARDLGASGFRAIFSRGETRFRFLFVFRGLELPARVGSLPVRREFFDAVGTDHVAPQIDLLNDFVHA